VVRVNWRPRRVGARLRRRGTASRRPSVAFLVWRDTSNPEGGGSELFVERVAEHLAGAGWDVTMCTSAHAAAAADEVRNGVRIRRRGGRLSVYPHGLAYLLSRRGRRTDVVVDVQNGVPFWSPLVRRAPIVNLVHHVHREQWQIIFPHRAARFGWWLESWLAPRLYRRHQYVTVSEATRLELTGLGIADDRIAIVHNGIDGPRAASSEPKSPTPTLCVLGRLVPHKQVEHALDTAATLRRSFPDLRVEVVGEGWWHQTLVEHVHRLDLADAVTFHGHVAVAERDAILDRSWVLLAPSVKEGWGIAIMEAAAHGVPAIGYRSAGGVCESIVDGETGWLADDVAELVKRTEELLVDATLRNWMADNARRRATQFGWEATGRLFAELLGEIGPTRL
jgi:glycosyltransferase involved in cell wall biosynthesis